MADAAQTGGTIAQLRAASQSGQLQGVDKPAAVPTTTPAAKPTPGQTAAESTAADRVGAAETLGHDNAAESDEPEVDDTDEAVEETPAEIDPNDPWEADLHGISTRAALEALKAGTLPPELAKALKVTAKINGVELPISVEEATRGYQRLSDYSKARNEVREQAKEVARRLQSFDQMVQGWKNPQQLRQGLQSLGLKDALFQAASHVAAEWLQDQELQKQNPAAFALQQQLKQREAQYNEMMAKLEQSNKPAVDDRAQQLTQQLGQMVPVAMEAAGIADSPVARTYMADNLRALWEEGTDLTPELVQQAAQATSEQLSDLARKHAGATAPKKPQAKPLPGRAGASPTAGNGAQIGNGRGGATIADFKKAFGTR